MTCVLNHDLWGCLWHAIQDAPDDDLPRLIAADYLADLGHPCADLVRRGPVPTPCNDFAWSIDDLLSLGGPERFLREMHWGHGWYPNHGVAVATLIFAWDAATRGRNRQAENPRP